MRADRDRKARFESRAADGGSLRWLRQIPGKPPLPRMLPGRVRSRAAMRTLPTPG